MSSRRRFTWCAAAGAAIASLVAFSAPSANAKQNDVTSIQILALNDFHGQLEVVNPIASSGGRIGSLTGPAATRACVAPGCVPAGGVEYLATHVRDLRKENPNTVFASAGDLIGATPLLSALFHDEPTIEAFNLMGLDYNGVGNHEFDEGIDELLRMQFGSRGGRGYTAARPDGCHPEDGCGDGDGFNGADFDFLAANVTYKDNGRTIFPPYAIHNFPGGVKVAFIGMTLEGTPLIVSPDGITSVDFLDEAESVNALVPHLQRRGVEAFVVLLHEGGTIAGQGTANTSQINTCSDPKGAIPPIVTAMDDAVDIVITGHTNWAVNCIIDGKVVTGAASQGRLITDIDATVNRKTGEFDEILVNNKIVTQDVAKASDMTALVDSYNVFAGPVAAVVVGETTAPLTTDLIGGTSGARETVLGRLIADAQLASTQGAGAQIAFMNPGGIRASLDSGDITYGEAFGVQPFSNVVTTKTMTGAQIEMLLEQQFVTSAGLPRTVVLQVPDGFTYTWDGAAAAAGNRVNPSTIKLNGVTLDPNSSYRVTMNSFLASGGDDFPAFNLGSDVVVGQDDLVALVAYLGVNDPYTPPLGTRITRLN